MPFLHEQIETVPLKTPTKNDSCGKRRYRSALLISLCNIGQKSLIRLCTRAICLLSSLCSHPIFIGFVMLMFKSLNLHLLIPNSINEYMFYFEMLMFKFLNLHLLLPHNSINEYMFYFHHVHWRFSIGIPVNRTTNI